MATPIQPLSSSLIHIAHPVHYSAPQQEWSSLDSNCCVDADGTVNSAEAQELLEVWGYVNDAPAPSQGTVFGFTWSLGPLCYCSINNVNTLLVRVRYKKDGAIFDSDYVERKFRVHAGGCTYNYAFETPEQTAARGAAPAAGPIQALLPRFYRLTVQTLGNEGKPLLGAFCGGLLQPAPVYLAYAEEASRPEAAVWRSAHLPPIAGRWTLCVRSRRCGLRGELTFQPPMENRVVPGVQFLCASWSAQGGNVLEPDRASVERGGGLLANAALVVEPA